PRGCSVKRVSPHSLAEMFRGKLVLVFGDSLSKNFAASLQCMLHAADSTAARSYRLAQKKTAEWGVEFPTYKIRFVSVFSNWLNNATSLPDKNGIEQHRIDLDGLDQRIKDLLPIADIVIFQATAWWMPPINRWYVGGKEATMKATAAYERGLTTLRDYVAGSGGGFKGRAVVMGVSPSHYDLPVAGVKKGSCKVNSMLTSAQTATLRSGDGSSSDLRAIQQRVLGGSSVVYMDVKPMSDWRPDGHIQNWSVKDAHTTLWCETTSPPAHASVPLGAVPLRALPVSPSPAFTNSVHPSAPAVKFSPTPLHSLPQPWRARSPLPAMAGSYPPILRMRCVAQTYDWGIKGSGSTVGRLYALGTSGSAEAAKDDVPYAELWMGTHPSGPSLVLPSAQPDEVDASCPALVKADVAAGEPQLLQEWLDAHPEALGATVQHKWPGQLPFLFKVLSVAKALSIQAHPDKRLAERLHATQPKNYKDANHKPEMALAVTNFEALCGFVTSRELRESIQSVPELRMAIGEHTADSVLRASKNGVNGVNGVNGAHEAQECAERRAFKDAFRALMTQDGAVIEKHLSSLVARLQAESKERELSDKEQLVQRLEHQYPGDVGVLSAFFLNHVTLLPGQAICLAANEPHAYLAGECIECMAASDNVVRAGLTPKYRDTDTLTSMLTYNQGRPQLLNGDRVTPHVTLYTPPFEEFEVEKITVPLGQTAALPEISGPSILLVFRGSGAISVAPANGLTKVHGCAAAVAAAPSYVQGVHVGDIFFVPAGSNKLLASAVVETDGTQNEEVLEMYRARVNAHVC
ncbi:unnamed protein product, partial [Closterium sp. Naga37s-1]